VSRAGSAGSARLRLTRTRTHASPCAPPPLHCRRRASRTAPRPRASRRPSWPPSSPTCPRAPGRRRSRRRRPLDAVAVRAPLQAVAATCAHAGHEHQGAAGALRARGGPAALPRQPMRRRPPLPPQMRYRPGLPLILRGIDLEVKPGTRVSVLGRTGACVRAPARACVCACACLPGEAALRLRRLHACACVRASVDRASS